jgi:hypothetical protein
MPAPLPLLAAVAALAAPVGTTTLDLGGPARASLREQGVAIRALAPARAGERRIVLPVAEGSLGDGAALAMRGGLRLRHGERRVTLRAWRARVRAGRTTLTAAVGGRRRTILAADVPPWRLDLDATSGGVWLRAVQVRLTRPGARTIRRALGLARLPAGVLGRVRAAASLGVEQGEPDGGPGGGPPPAGCEPALAPGAVAPAPPPLARPAGAVEVAAARIVWRPRESFIRYVDGGEGAIASDGASAGPAEALPGSPEPLVYSFGFALRPGSWHDAASGAADLLARGAIRFRYAAHGIDITLRDPEIELNGSASRAVFVLAGADCTDRDDVRAELFALAPGAPAGHDYGEVPATITAAGADAFSGFYLPGDPWGSFEVAFTPAP